MEARHGSFQAAQVPPQLSSRHPRQRYVLARTPRVPTVRIVLGHYELGTSEWRALWEHPAAGRRGKSHLQQMSSYPAWWDRTFHTRPKRAATRALERKVLLGADPDAVVWPLGSHRPHAYFW